MSRTQVKQKLPKKLSVEALQDITLQFGGHETRNEGVCAMEAVAWLAGEKHSDMPKCACPLISAVMAHLNDHIEDADRQKLKKLLPSVVGSKGTKTTLNRRMQLVRDYYLRLPLHARFVVPYVNETKQELFKRMAFALPLAEKQDLLAKMLIVSAPSKAKRVVKR